MVNCTAAERTDFTGAVYGDYMDGIESIVTAIIQPEFDIHFSFE
jgi:hypothetical protein